MNVERQASVVRPVFRLGQVIEQRKEAEGSYLELQKKIAQAWRATSGQGSAKPPVDRRKLRDLVEHAHDPERNVVVSLHQLRAIDSYLDRFNEGLAFRPLLERPDLLRALAESGEIAFLVGSKVHEGRVDLSQWDVLSVAEIQRGVNRSTSSVHFDILDVLLEDDDEFAGEYEDEPWSGVLKDHGPSVVCIGSPRAVHAAEVMLADMFGVTPFEPSPPHDDHLPFHFVRPIEPEHQRVPSRFVLHSDDIRNTHLAEAVEVDAGTHALCVGDEVRLADRLDGSSPRVRTFGVVAAQRRPSGRLWTVVAGLTGAATHACAQALEQLHAGLPRVVSGPPPVMWAVVEALVEEDGRRPGRGIYTVVRHSVAEEPRRWEQPR